MSEVLVDVVFYGTMALGVMAVVLLPLAFLADRRVERRRRAAGQTAGEPKKTSASA